MPLQPPKAINRAPLLHNQGQLIRVVSSVVWYGLQFQCAWQQRWALLRFPWIYKSHLQKLVKAGTGSAELIAVSSLVVRDVYCVYINPKGFLKSRCCIYRQHFS